MKKITFKKYIIIIFKITDLEFCICYVLISNMYIYTWHWSEGPQGLVLDPPFFLLGQTFVA